MMVDEIAKTRGLTSKPFGVDLLTAVAGPGRDQVQSVIDGGARVFVAGLGVPRDVIDLCHDEQRAGREHVREGAARDRRGRSGLRHRRRAGNRGRRPHRTDRDHGARSSGRRRRRRSRARRGRGRALRRARPRSLARARRRRRVDRHALHRHAGGTRGAGLQGRPASGSQRTAPSSHGRTPARRVVSCATNGPSTSRSIRKS